MAAKSGLKQVIQSVARLLSPPPAAGGQEQSSHNPNVDMLPTGFRSLDKALGSGGLPHGHMIELIGPADTMRSGGAACTAAKIAAKVQRQQKTVTIIDMSHSFDPWQAQRCGLAAPQLLLHRPETFYDAVATLEEAARTATLVVVLLGTVPRLLNQVEPARCRTLLHRLQGIVHRSAGVFLFITFPQDDTPFSPANYPAGFALPQAASLRLWLQDEDWRFKSGLATAYKATLAVIKNDLGQVGQAANIRIKFN